MSRRNPSVSRLAGRLGRGFRRLGRRLAARGLGRRRILVRLAMVMVTPMMVVGAVARRRRRGVMLVMAARGVVVMMAAALASMMMSRMMMAVAAVMAGLGRFLARRMPVLVVVHRLGGGRHGDGEGPHGRQRHKNSGHGHISYNGFAASPAADSARCGDQPPHQASRRAICHTPFCRTIYGPPTN